MSRLALTPTNVPASTTDISTPTLRTGDLYYNTATSSLMVYTGSTWTAVGGSDHRRNMRFYEKLLQPIPFGFFVLGLIILNPLHIPPDSEARAEVPVVIKPVLIERTPEAAKELAQKLLPSWGWKTEAQWQCLESLWTKESNWRPDAYNRKASLS